MSKFFTEIDHDTTEIVKSVNFFLQVVKWDWHILQTLAANFTAVGKKICNDDERLLRPLADQFGGTLRLIRFPPKCIYRWHKDYFFSCSLNMILEEYNCHTLFHVENQNAEISTVEELVYTPNRFYLFNSQERHIVINLDEKPRVLVTMTFSKDYSYDIIKDWYENSYK